MVTKMRGAPPKTPPYQRIRARRAQSSRPQFGLLATRRLSIFARLALLFLIVTTQVPFLITIWSSAREWNLMTSGSGRFIGLGNYLAVFRTPGFVESLWNTARMTVTSVLVTLILGTVLALLLNRNFKGKGFARTLIFSAFLVPPSAAALIWKTTMLNPTGGLVGFLLTPFGGHGVDWVNASPMGVIITVISWQWIPFAMLIVLAGLQSQDESVKEAASLDGAGKIRTFWYFTLPHLRPHLEVSALLGGIFISQLLDPVFLITQGGLGTETTTAAYKLHSLAFRSFDVGLASAFGVIVALLTIAACLVLLRFLIKSTSEVE